MGRPRELTEKERQRLRKQGLRPIEIWVPDLDAPGMAEELERQAAAIAEADEKDGIFEWLEAVHSMDKADGRD
jgi:hypothetical protein